MQKSPSALYRASFPSGFRALIDRLVERDYGERSVVGGDESAVIFRAPFPPKEPAYAQSLSLVVDLASARNIEDAYRLFAQRSGSGAALSALERAASSPFFSGRHPTRFALRGFVRGEPSSVQRDDRGALERTIERATGLRADSQRPDLELQVSLRDDLSAQFLASARVAKADDRERGALPRSTARLLCELSQPSEEDVFLDPFMGSGSLPLERARMGPYSMIFAGDVDELCLASFKDELKTEARKSPSFERKRRTIFPKLIDARDLSRFEAAFFTAIVTDPPWGLYEKMSQEELLGLYSGFLRGAFRVLKADGRLVLLLGRESPLERAMAECGEKWRIQEDYGVLVSGRKARAVRLQKA